VTKESLRDYTLYTSSPEETAIVEIMLRLKLYLLVEQEQRFISIVSNINRLCVALPGHVGFSLANCSYENDTNRYIIRIISDQELARVD
jgi:hypothetical protein